MPRTPEPALTTSPEAFDWSALYADGPSLLSAVPGFYAQTARESADDTR